MEIPRKPAWRRSERLISKKDKISARERKKAKKKTWGGTQAFYSDPNEIIIT